MEQIFFEGRNYRLFFDERAYDNLTRDLRKIPRPEEVREVVEREGGKLVHKFKLRESYAYIYAAIFPEAFSRLLKDAQAAFGKAVSENKATSVHDFFVRTMSTVVKVNLNPYWDFRAELVFIPDRDEGMEMSHFILLNESSMKYFDMIITTAWKDFEREKQDQSQTRNVSEKESVTEAF